jgi:tripartite-type tricarboxylate transporter receptor subunit TctC
MKRIVLAGVAVTFAMLAAWSLPATAEDKWPTQPIRIINSFAAGGATDIVLRTAAEELRGILGVNVIVENKPGANGIIAIEEVSRAKPDGYTLLGGPSSMTSGLLSMTDKLSFAFDDKLAMVTPVGEGPPAMILVRKDMKLNTWKEFVDYSKANPGKLRYASPGALTGPHLDMVILAHRLNVQWTHLPQRGGGGILKALSNGDANFGNLNVAVAAPLLKAGEVVPVATVLPKRLQKWPDVPSVTEFGVSDVGNTLWHAVWAPSGTPPEIMDKLFVAIQKSLKGKRMLELYEKSEMWAPELASVADSQAWYKKAMENFIKVHEEAQPLLAKQN